MSSRPTVVLIPGSFCSANAYDPIVTPLRSKGYDIQVLEPPCYPAGYERKSDGAPPNMYADARYIKEHVEKLVDEGKEVVFVAHSYGGTQTSQAQTCTFRICCTWLITTRDYRHPSNRVPQGHN